MYEIPNNMGVLSIGPTCGFCIYKDMLSLTLHGKLCPKIIPQNSASQEVEFISLKTEIKTIFRPFLHILSIF